MNYPGQGMYNPYFGNYMNQLPQIPSQVQQNNNTVGKVVDSLEMVRGIDIPMDGNPYYFPKADGSIVYSKKWLPNCTTQITAYMPQNIDELNNVTPNSTERLETANMFDTELCRKIDSIEQKMDLLLKGAGNESKRTTKSNNAKQSDNE